MSNKRTGMKLLYIGDIGDTTPLYHPITAPSPEIDLDALDARQMMNLAIENGFQVRDLIGISHCYEHVDMVLLGDRKLPDGMNLFENCSYCKNCFQLFRDKKLMT